MCEKIAISDKFIKVVDTLVVFAKIAISTVAKIATSAVKLLCLQLYTLKTNAEKIE